MTATVRSIDEPWQEAVQATINNEADLVEYLVRLVKERHVPSRLLGTVLDDLFHDLRRKVIRHIQKAGESSGG